jgi:hypothetical protein
MSHIPNMVVHLTEVYKESDHTGNDREEWQVCQSPINATPHVLIQASMVLPTHQRTIKDSLHGRVLLW